MKVRHRDINVEASSTRTYFGLNALFFAVRCASALLLAGAHRAAIMIGVPGRESRDNSRHCCERIVGTAVGRCCSVLVCCSSAPLLCCAVYVFVGGCTLSAAQFFKIELLAPYS